MNKLAIILFCLIPLTCAFKYRLPPPHEDHGKLIQKREAGVGSDKIPPFRHTEDENVRKTFNNLAKSDDEPRLPGENLIPKNRHPRAVDENPGASHHSDFIKDAIMKDVKEDNEPRLLGENLIPKNRHPRDVSGDKPVEENSGSSHHSDFIKDMIRGLINRRKEGAENKDDEPRLLGESLIPKNRHPKITPLLKVNDDDLPLLLKSLRLRPGSKDYQEIVDKFLNSRKDGSKMLEKMNSDESLPLLMKTLRLRPGSKEYQEIIDNYIKSMTDGPGKYGDADLTDRYDRLMNNDHGIFAVRSNECKDEDRQATLQCFSGLIKNFDLDIVDGKLPSIFTVFSKFKNMEPSAAQKIFKDFRSCYKTTPESCYYYEELLKITQSKLEGDGLAAFMAVIDFGLESVHNVKVTKCYARQFLKAMMMVDITEEECKAVKDVFVLSIQRFNERCAEVEPKEGDLKALLEPLIKRTSIIKTCPNMLSELGL